MPLSDGKAALFQDGGSLYVVLGASPLAHPGWVGSQAAPKYGAQRCCFVSGFEVRALWRFQKSKMKQFNGLSNVLLNDTLRF